MIDYYTMKFLAEIVAFLSLTPLVLMFYLVRGRIEYLFGRRETQLVLVGILIFWLGYLTNVMNDVFPTELMKVLDDILVAVGALWILIFSRPFYVKMKVSISPAKLSNGITKVKPGGYLWRANLSIKSLLELLPGMKVIGIARNPEKFKELNIPHLWITKIEGENTIAPTRLAPLLQYIIEESGENTAVILEGLEYLILENGFESVFKFLTSLKDYLLAKNSLLVIVLDPKSLDEKHLKLLEREFRWLEGSS